MNAIAVSKSSRQNRLEGIALTAIFQGLPNLAAVALLYKLTGSHVAEKGGVVIFVVLGSIVQGLFTPWLAANFPRLARHSYEPLFFDANLSFAEKITRWRTQPTTSLQLVTNLLMLSLLAVGVASLG